MKLYQKSRPVKDPVFYAKWNKAHDHCQCCGVPDHQAAWPGVSTHHMVRPGRSDEACNLLRLCHRCHQLAEGLMVPDENGDSYPTLPLSVCLEIKRLREPDDLDLARLAVLKSCDMPDFKPLPAAFAREWCRWRHGGDCGCCDDLVD